MLPTEQREVLILVGATGLSYEEAATICEVEIGTIKSRLSRARSKLVELLALDEDAKPPAQRNKGRAGGIAVNDVVHRLGDGVEVSAGMPQQAAALDHIGAA